MIKVWAVKVALYIDRMMTDFSVLCGCYDGLAYFYCVPTL